jgi:hypothetical protein
MATLAIAGDAIFRRTGRGWLVYVRDFRDKVLRRDHELRELESKPYAGPVHAQPLDPSEVAAVRDTLRAERDAYDEIKRWARANGAAHVAALEHIFEKHSSQQAAADAHGITRKRVRFAIPQIWARIEGARRKMG